MDQESSFTPNPDYVPETVAEQSRPQPAATGNGAWDAHQFKLRVEGIRRQAQAFTSVSVVFALIGLAGILFQNWPWVGSFLAMAIWLYLVAQVIYIRANTEK